MLGFSAEIDHGYSWMTWGSASKFQKHMGIGSVATTLHFFGFWRVLNDHSMSSKPCVQLRMLRYPQGIPGQYDAMAITGQQWPHSRGTLVYTDHIHVKSRGFPSQPAVIMPRWGDLVLEFSADSPTKWAKWRPQRAYLQACRSGAFSQSVTSSAVVWEHGCSQPQRLICPARTGPCTRHIVPGGICRVTWTCEGMPNEPRKGPGNGPAVINLRHLHPSEEERLFSSQMLVTPVLAIPSRFCIYRIYVIMS